MCIIVISRGTFSGGEALAEAVAERLAYRCISRESLVAVAKAYGVPAEELTAAMEKRPSLLERVVGEHTVYLALMRAAMCEQARRDKLVYHGHLGQFLLPGISHVISVRVIADMAFRIRAVEEQQGLTREGASAHIQTVDRQRRERTRFLFGVDWDDPHLYDLVVNLSRMSLESACETLTYLPNRLEFTPTPASLKALEDLAQSSWARVRAGIALDPTYPASMHLNS